MNDLPGVSLYFRRGEMILDFKFKLHDIGKTDTLNNNSVLHEISA